MAKNILKKKQRIAHNKIYNEGQEMYPMDCDILSSIMEGMDNNILTPMKSNKFDMDFMEFSKTPKQKNTHSSNNQSQMCVPRLRNFGVSRKHPLMEKTQKTLKQLQHNRKMPKPRAHLAGLSKSPVRKSPSIENYSVPNAKIKKTKSAINNVKNSGNSQNKSTVEPKDKIPSKQQKLPASKRNISVEQSSVKSASKKQESFLTKKDLDKSQLKNHEITDNSSDSDDYEKFIRKEKRDLPKKPKNLKNSKKKTTVSTRRGAGTKRKTVSKPPLSPESDSDSSDEEFSTKSNKKSKRRRKSNVDQQSALIEESESNLYVNDEPCYDSSASSDDLTPLSMLKSNLQSSSDCHESPFVTEISNDNSNQQCGLSSNKNLYVASTVGHDKPKVLQKTSDTASLVASQPSILPEMPSSASLKGNSHSSVNKMSSIQSSVSTTVSSIQSSVSTAVSSNQSSVSTAVSNVQPMVSHESSTIVSKKGNSPVSCSAYGTSSVSVVGNGPCSLKSDLLNASVKEENVSNVHIKQENNSLVVDLTESDNECDNSFTVMPKIVMTSSQNENKFPIDCGKVDTDEDSDIEMVDVIVYPLPNELERSRRNVESNSSGTDKLHIKTEVNQTSPSSYAKTQNNQKPIDKLPTSLPKIQIKNEPVFSTDICKLFTEKTPEDETLKHSNLNRDNTQMNPGVTEQSSLLLNKVKSEPEEDCEIVFVNVSSSDTSQKLPTVQACSSKTIKSEKDFEIVKPSTSVNEILSSKVLLKKNDCDSSNLSHGTDIYNKNSALQKEEKNDEARLKALYQELVHEFGTYQEIIQTEQSVEATFKMLEMRQAEKVKTQLKKMDSIVKASKLIKGNSDHSNAIKEIDKLLNSDLSSMRALPPVIPTADINNLDISIKDLKTFASMNIVPLSSISEKDIKPNLSDLQSLVKKEPGTSQETNNMSFGEKCVVCGKDAAAACQQCAKVFFCSQDCGKKYWHEGHKDACAKS